MAFTVDDFHDLVELLAQRPEWQADLRRLVLTDELLALPGIVRDLAVQVSELAEAQRRTEAAVVALAEAQQHTNWLLSAHGVQLDRIEGALGDLQGWRLERKYHDNAPAYFADLMRGARALPKHELGRLLDEALDAGILSRVECKDVLRADVVVRGRRWEERDELHLVVEVSVGIGPDDVRRAVDRAGILGKVRSALPVVAGERILPDAQDLADARGVTVVLNGRERSTSSAE